MRRAAAYVPQDNFLFSDTIARNIDFTESVPDRERVSMLGLGVHGGDGVVQDQDGGVFHQGPGDGVVLAVMLASIAYELASPLIMGRVEELIKDRFEPSVLLRWVAL